MIEAPHESELISLEEIKQMEAAISSCWHTHREMIDDALWGDAPRDGMTQPELHSRVKGIFQQLVGETGVLKMTACIRQPSLKSLARLARAFDDLAAACQETPPLVELVLAKLLAEPAIADFRKKMIESDTKNVVGSITNSLNQLVLAVQTFWQEHGATFYGADIPEDELEETAVIRHQLIGDIDGILGHSDAAKECLQLAEQLSGPIRQREMRDALDSMRPLGFIFDELDAKSNHIKSAITKQALRRLLDDPAVIAFRQKMLARETRDNAKVICDTVAPI